MIKTIDAASRSCPLDGVHSFCRGPNCMLWWSEVPDSEYGDCSIREYIAFKMRK